MRLLMQLLWTAFALFVAPLASAADRPNFVWLVSEDNSAHYLRMYNPQGAPTPHIEALARQGLQFQHAFSNGAVCSVARTTLITACYAPRIGTQFHRRAVSVPMPEGLQMFPAYLREAGYYTTNNQKKDYNAEEGPGVWDESSRTASWRSRGADQPFFHMQSFPTTHESSLHFPANAMRNEATETDPEHVSVAPYHPDTPVFRYTNARYRDRIRQMDAEVGEVVAQLAADGLLEDTFVFYFGDHGGVLPRGKGYAYESGLHVPLVIRVPQNWKHLVDGPLGTAVRGFVSFVDFGPTLLNLAGIEVPSQVDGRPFLGRGITREMLEQRQETIGYADRFDEKYDLVRTLRQGDLKYVRSYQPFNIDALQNNYRYRMLAYQEWRDLYHQGQLNQLRQQFFRPRAAEMLFDLSTDPHETLNLADDPRYSEALLRMRQRLSQWVSSLPDLSFYPESVLVERAFDAPVPFGRRHQADIARLVQIADLSLVSFGEAHDGVAEALTSADPWQRYWGLIVCSVFGEHARPLVPAARRLAQQDPEPLVRTRAAEFLALIGAADPRPTIEEAVRQSDSTVEAGLILNTVVLLRDAKGFTFDIKPSMLPARDGIGDDILDRRMQYLGRERS